MHGYARERLYGDGLTSGCGRDARRNGPAEGFRVNNNVAERCMLRVACRMLGVACWVLYVACCMVHVVCRMSYVVWRILYGASCIAHLVWRILYADAGTSGGYASAMRLFSRRLAGTQAGARS